MKIRETTRQKEKENFFSTEDKTSTTLADSYLIEHSKREFPARQTRFFLLYKACVPHFNVIEVLMMGFYSL